MEYTNPSPAEKPIYAVTGENMAQYAEILPEGVQALLKKYGAEGFRLDVYPTHRNAAQPQWFYDGSKQNAAAANLVADGQKIEGNVPGVPFPVPQGALEVLWNHMIRFQGYKKK